jgi:hypothetical protein
MTAFQGIWYCIYMLLLFAAAISMITAMHTFN